MIKIENVNFSYGIESEDIDSKAGLKNINLHVNRGECILLCGKSGCGKTTLTHLINGLIPKHYEGEFSGVVAIDNEDISNVPLYKISRKVSSVFQNPKSQFFNIDTTSEILFKLENQGVSKEDMEEKLSEITRQFHIGPLLHRDIFQLSGGEKQKIAIASAYVSESEVIVFDEPSSNLDTWSIETIKKMIEILKNAGKTIVIAEHRLYFLKGLVDKVAYMENGTISEIYSGEDFFAMDPIAKRKKGLRHTDFSHFLPKTREKKEISKFLNIENLCFSYGERRGLNPFKRQRRVPNIHIEKFQFPLGHIVGIVGKNGQGKTTFAKCLMALEKKSKGIVSLDNELLKGKKRKRSGYMVMQDVNHQLFTESVGEELLLGAAESWDRESVESLLKNLQLNHMEECHPMALSGGQKQRVAVASAITAQAKLLFFDEPTSGMDYENMERTSVLIRNLIQPHNIVFVISHDFEFLAQTVDMVVQMESGSFHDVYPFDDNGLDKLKSFMGIGSCEGVN